MIALQEQQDFDFEGIGLLTLLIAERLRRGIIDAEAAAKQLSEIQRGTNGR